MASKHEQAWRAAIEDPESFWAEAAEGIDWESRWDAVLDGNATAGYRWFQGATLNTCFNAVDRHVDGGRAEQRALVYDSPITGQQRTFTYAELKDEVAKTAGMLRNLGVDTGDRVIIYMPMVPEAVFAMLACARIGAIHSVVFGGFAAKELATRIDDAQPKVVLTASCGIEPGRIVEYKPLLEAASELASFQYDACVVLQRQQHRCELNDARDRDWATLLQEAEPADCVPVAATDPLYILYTSGTTGKPKGVVRDNGGHAVAMHWSLGNVYGMQPGETFWAASDIGWVVGHSYIVYAPLICGCTTILFEGKPVGTPDPGAFWRVIDEHRVDVLFTAPTALRAIKREDPAAEYVGKHDISTLRTLFLAGERADPPSIEWAEKSLGVPVIDHWWQTETGWAIASNCLGIEQLPVKRGSPARAVPGFDVRCLDDGGNEVEPGQPGALCVRLPMPPGCLATLWHDEAGYRSAYMEQFPGYYSTSDAGFVDQDGYVWVMSRTDDIINTAGHRLSTGAMEEVLATHPDVAECAVIGVADATKGQVPVGFAVLSAGATRSHADVCEDIVGMVRETIGPVAAYKKTAIVARLPKTRSGKILRSTMRRIADGVDYDVPATIDDPAILDETRVALEAVGLGKKTEQD
ncbi:MAG: propionyl-CoA synthetase [Woeseiaceae bacterium]|nr:propionyl-CoA synthetase [Woeseiaceae bacterium]